MVLTFNPGVLSCGVIERFELSSGSRVLCIMGDVWDTLPMFVFLGVWCFFKSKPRVRDTAKLGV